MTNIQKVYRNVLAFTTLTGLRQSEALQSIKMIKIDRQYYINKKTMLIENFRFPQFFIRRTKKAYISIINETILDLARNSGTLHSYNSLASGIRRDNSYYDINTKYSR